MDEQGGRFRKKRTNFSLVSNEIIRNDSVSLKAKGLYALIQSYITLDNFILYKGFLQNHCQEGKKAFESAWKELKDKGYLIQYRMKNAQNQFYYEYDLLDSPIPQNGGAGKPIPQNGDSGKGSTPEPGASGMGEHISKPRGSKLYQSNTVSNQIVSVAEIQKQIDYDTFSDADKEQIDEMILLIVEVLNKDDNAPMRISRMNVPAAQVKARFKMLNQSHIEYCCHTLRNNLSKVKNIKSYLLTTLYNAPATMNCYYQQAVNHDLSC